ncbi:MAG: leucine-rich repeat domain-containing protein [Bacteroidales bacterium]|nr:leucine-rich repeat domain-containing protein [Bacteroidales bacterium]
MTSVIFNAESCISAGSSGSAFYGCSYLANITFGNNVKRIPSFLCDGCSGLTSISIPSGVISIGERAFGGCSGLTSVTIPNSVTSIGDGAFYGCSGLTSVTIGSGVTSIDNSAFRSCSGLTSVIFNANNCISAGSTSSPIFYGCNNLINITFGNNVNRIPNYLCYNCTGLTSVIVPDSVAALGSKCFAGCSALESATIGSHVERMEGIFYGCTRLHSLKIKAIYPPICDSETFYEVPNYVEVLIPCGSMPYYTVSDYWQDFPYMEEDCSAIEDVDNSNCSVYSTNCRIVVQGAEGVEIKVYDLTGREVVKATRNGETPVLPTGVYLVKVGTLPARKVVVIR